MSNFRLRNPDCVLIHIPKTGGTTIRKCLWNSEYDGPEFGVIPPEWEGLFKFAMVRHPCDRLVSAWKMFTEGAKGDESWKLPPDAKPLTIDEFIAIVVNEDIIYDQRRKTFAERIRHHAIPQTHPFNCLHLADYVGRFERYDESLATIGERLGIVITKPPKIHYTTRVPWDQVIKGDSLKSCLEFYHEDFSKLGYSPVPD